MNIPKYRKITSLTKDEIEPIMEIIYPSSLEDSNFSFTIDELNEENNTIYITCDCCFIEEGEPVWCEDYFVLTEEGIECYDIAITSKDHNLIKKYLFSLGCCALLDNNPYII